MIECVRIASGPGQNADKRELGSMVFWVAWSAGTRPAFGQERMIALLGVELAGDFRMAGKAARR
jgi:hypothetical protein